MPDLSHLWQRFLLTATLLMGLAIGVATTVFGYSNLTSVDVRWSVLHIDHVPLWVVVVLPVTITMVAATIYHWMDGLHHFTEHMRHRRRVHELEAEVVSLRAHLDHVLEMPGHTAETDRRGRKAALPPPSEGISPAAATSPGDLSELAGDVAPDLGGGPATPEPAALPKSAVTTVVGSVPRPSRNAAKRARRKQAARASGARLAAKGQSKPKRGRATTVGGVRRAILGSDGGITNIKQEGRAASPAKKA